jgi:hypothetical protein
MAVRWTGSGGSSSGVWENGSNWSSGAVPTSSDDVYLNSDARLGSYTVTVSPGAYDTARSLSMYVTVSDTATTTLNISSGSALMVGGDVHMGHGTAINVSGAFYILGGLRLAGGNGNPGGRPPPTIAIKGGTFTIHDAFGTRMVSSAIAISFNSGTSDTLTLGGAETGRHTIGNAVTNFGIGDKIDLSNAGSLSGLGLVDHGGGSYTLHTIVGTYNFSSISLASGALHAQSDGRAGVELFVCYQAGTRILTPRGEIAVEDLREGDLVTTFSGRGPIHKPITWIGQMRESLDGHPDPEMAAPVRIRAGAVAENIPHRDLLVSPDHAICLDGVLIPAKELINDATIVQELDFGEVHYFHIELEQHDILLAEGLTAESYLDTGNRDAFAAYRATPVARQEAEPRVG